MGNTFFDKIIWHSLKLSANKIVSAKVINVSYAGYRKVWL